MQNKDLDPIINSSYSQIREWHKHVNSSLAWRIYSGGFNQHWVKAEDVYYYDKKGNQYIDFLGGYGLNCIGHNHPRIKQLINDFLSADTPIFMQAGLLPGPGALAQKLCDLTGLDNCYFANSGTEVVEAGLKIARKATGRKRVVYAEGGFHGKSLGSLSITARPKYQEPFQPLIPQCTCVPFNDVAAIKKELQTNDVAVVVIEPIQGEGGIIVPDENYLKEVRALCDRYSTLLFLDEIQSSMGRTGKMFAYEWSNIKPDILTLAKGLSGVMIPIGAMVTTSKVWQNAYGKRKECTQQTSTFGGNNLATIVALTTLKIIEEENLSANAQKQGDYLMTELLKLKEKYPKLITDVRGKGLMLGVEFNDAPNGAAKATSKVLSATLGENIVVSISQLLINKHHIVTQYTLNNAKALRFEPALTIQKDHIDSLISALDKVLSKNFFGVLMNSGKIMADVLIKK